MLQGGSKNKEVTLSDFLPRWWFDELSEEEMAQEALENKAAKVFAMFGGVDTRRGG